MSKDFEEFELVICSQIKGEATAKSLGIYSTEDNEVVIDYISTGWFINPIIEIPKI